MTVAPQDSPDPKGPFAAGLLRTSARALVQAVLLRMQKECPEVLSGVPASFADPRDDLEVRLRQLAAAVEFDRPALMAHAVAWYRVALHHRGVGIGYLEQSMAAMESVLAEELPSAVVPMVRKHLAAARETIATADVELPTVLDKNAPHGLLACRFLLAVLEGRGDDAIDLMRNALADGLSVADLHDAVLLPVQRETGRMWLMGEIQVADEHYGSALVNRVLSLAEERLPRPAADAKVVLTMGVAGDMHGFGMRIVAQRLVLAGYRVHHLGADMPASDLEGALHGRQFALVAIGATMVLHLHTLAATVAELRRLLGQGVPILVGGEPFRIVPDLYRLVGADGGASDAGTAVATTTRLLSRGAGA